MLVAKVHAKMEVFDVLPPQRFILRFIILEFQYELSCILAAEKVRKNDVVDSFIVMRERVFDAVCEDHHDGVRILRLYRPMNKDVRLRIGNGGNDEFSASEVERFEEIKIARISEFGGDSPLI